MKLVSMTSEFATLPDEYDPMELHKLEGSILVVVGSDTDEGMMEGFQLLIGSVYTIIRAKDMKPHHFNDYRHILMLEQ